MRARPHPLHDLWLGPHITNLATLSTRPRLFILAKRIDGILDLTPQIRTHKTRLVHHTPTASTIPPQPILFTLWSRLLNHHTHRISKPDGVMRRIPRQQKHLALVNVDVAEGARGLDGLEQHAATVLVEEFGGAVDVVVCSCIWAADDHDG